MPLGYDVLHANFFMSGFAGLRARHALGLPLVMTFHALGKVRRLHQGSTDGFQRFEIEDTLVREADCLVVECPQDLDDLVQLYDADPRRVQTVPCDFDAAEFTPLERGAARRALGQHGFCVLQLGRLVPLKDIDNDPCARLPAPRGRRAGDAVCGRRQRRAAQRPGHAGDWAPTGHGRSRGVADSVVFVGRRGRVLRLFYSGADVFVTTPWFEPFGSTRVEAMACGVPVVGADVGGMHSTVVDGQTGYLVPPKAPAALAARLAQFAADQVHARQLG